MMYAPIFWPESDQVSPLVLEAEKRIIEEEGRMHVAGIYYALESDSRQQRRWLAEQMVREGLRLGARLPVCQFCETPVFPFEKRQELAGAVLHFGCALESWYASSSYPTDADFAEADYPRGESAA
jgi:hypothetical protein